MGSIAIIITVAYGVVVILGSILAIGLWRSTNSRRRVDTHKLAERERSWLVAVFLALVALLFATIFFTPYGKTAGNGPVQVVRVTGQQFAWKIEPSTVKAGVKVEFDVTSIDVSHGFGVYTDKLKFLFQVQAAPPDPSKPAGTPGPVTKIFHTFKTPGTYKVLCLEFCGRDHHLMEAQFEVTPAQVSAS